MVFRHKWLCTSLALVIASCSTLSHASSVDQINSAEAKRIQDGQKSQKTIDAVSSQTDTLVGKLRGETKIVDGLKIYNQQLQKQIDGQLAAIGQLEKSISQVAIIERQIVPLMIKMIESLELFVGLDMPFSLEERRERVEKLKSYMSEANISAAERFRKVLEAYEIENEFGRTIESYSDTLNFEGSELSVEILRIGRVGLYFQTKDGKKSGFWDKEAKTWASLDSSYNRHIRKAIRVAKKQVAPELLTVPVAVAENS